METLQVQIRKGEKGEPAVVRIGGFIDSSNSGKFEEVMTELIKNGYVRLIIDMEKLEYINSLGVSVLIIVYDSVKDRGGIKFVKVPPKIYKLFDIFGILILIDTFPNEEKAVNSFDITEVKIEFKKKFPAETRCPKCSFGSNVSFSEIYKCPKCGEIFFVDQDVNVKALNKGDDVETVSLKADLSIKADISYVVVIRKFVSILSSKEGFSEESTGEIELAADEAVSNIIEHSYGFDPSKIINITISTEGRKFIVKITDWGKEYSINDNNEEFGISISARRGRGWFIIKSMMNEVKYSREEGRNVLILTKIKQNAGPDKTEFILP